MITRPWRNENNWAPPEVPAGTFRSAAALAAHDTTTVTGSTPRADQSCTCAACQGRRCHFNNSAKRTQCMIIHVMQVKVCRYIDGILPPLLSCEPHVNTGKISDWIFSGGL